MFIQHSIDKSHESAPGLLLAIRSPRGHVTSFKVPDKFDAEIIRIGRALDLAADYMNPSLAWKPRHEIVSWKRPADSNSTCGGSGAYAQALV